MKSEANCLIAQSGGPTTVINASLAGVIEKALNGTNIHQIYGAIHGIQGVIDDNLLNLTDIFKDNDSTIQQLKTTPAMYLGSCRYKLSDFTENISDYSIIFQTLKKYSVKYFLYIGGNDSMDTVDKLSSYGKSINSDIKFIGIPKTIDNDLECIDHTPGFGSAAKYIAASILEIAHDTYIYDIESVTIIEIMGRNAGWLTAAAALARNEYSAAPHLIYLPEKPFSTGRFVTDIKEEFTRRKHVIVAVSEGVKDIAGTYISAESAKTDQFGHVMLSGTGKYLEGLIKHTIGCKVRSIELNVLQRCAAHSSSLTDIEEAFQLGQYGLDAALKDESGVMVTLNRTSNFPYTVEYGTIPINEVANLEKKIPIDWINEAGNDITNELIEYIKPLIQGEAPIKYIDGLPVYLSVDHLIKKK